MAFDVIGKLVIVERKLKNGTGSFMVADLACAEGKFSIRNDVLDQFSPGTYEGKFTVQSFFPKPYVASSGQVIVDIRATLDWDQLAIMAQSENVEEESLAISTVAVEAEITQETEKTEPVQEVVKSIDQDNIILSREVFEKALANKECRIKLDNSMPEFREFIRMIKATDAYKFNGTDQAWYLKEAA